MCVEGPTLWLQGPGSRMKLTCSTILLYCVTLAPLHQVIEISDSDDEGAGPAAGRGSLLAAGRPHVSEEGKAKGGADLAGGGQLVAGRLPTRDVDGPQCIPVKGEPPSDAAAVPCGLITPGDAQGMPRPGGTAPPSRSAAGVNPADPSQQGIDPRHCGHDNNNSLRHILVKGEPAAEAAPPPCGLISPAAGPLDGLGPGSQQERNSPQPTALALGGGVVTLRGASAPGRSSPGTTGGCSFPVTFAVLPEGSSVHHEVLADMAFEVSEGGDIEDEVSGSSSGEKGCFCHRITRKRWGMKVMACLASKMCGWSPRFFYD